MLLNVASLIVGIIGIIVSIILWRWNWNVIAKYNKLLSRIYNTNWSDDDSINQFRKDAKKLHELRKSFVEKKLCYENKDAFTSCILNAMFNVFDDFEILN